MHPLRRHTISFQHAIDGLRYTFKSQPNFRVHSIFAILAISAGFFFSITPSEWSVVVLVISWVLVAEMINTSIEAVIDLHTSLYHDLAKIAKDVSAGMVLLSATMAVIVALIIFLPKIWLLF